MANGVCIANHHASVHVKNGQVTSFSSSFGTAQHFFQKRSCSICRQGHSGLCKGVCHSASAQLGIPVYSDFKHALEYVEQPDGKIVYAYKLQLRNTPVTKWVQVWCHADTGRVIQAVDFANKASYKAIPVPRRDPTEGFSMVAETSKGQLWQGWQSGDAVVVTVLNTSDVDNADFFTPPDGQPGEMNMYSFTYTHPNRSSGLDSGIAIHEYGHGVSNRLTGGSATGGCLSTAEARGMGEGWSDMMALFVLAKKSDTATTSIPMGTYVEGKPGGCQQVRDSQGHLPSVVSAPRPPTPAKMTFSVPSECDGDAPSPDPTTTTTRRSRTTTTKISRTTTKKARTTSRAPEPTDEPDDEPTDESDDDPTFELDEFAKM
ncbi:hypothetical protein BASA83_005827 [Batrachochytrium salamandrivorans]|nr:hypothetical protein BASA83_005827 [Batrachochytrium salamandrivorans]